MSILGDLPMDGHLHIQGKIGYMPQNAWVFSGTVRDNILFGEAMEHHKYSRVLQLCQLNAVRLLRHVFFHLVWILSLFYPRWCKYRLLHIYCIDQYTAIEINLVIIFHMFRESSPSSFQQDLAHFPHGDQTFVGERGLLLSGGQKARLNLARYSLKSYRYETGYWKLSRCWN